MTRFWLISCIILPQHSTAALAAAAAVAARCKRWYGRWMRVGTLHRGAHAMTRLFVYWKVIITVRSATEKSCLHVAVDR